MKKVISLILCIAMLVCVAVIPANAGDKILVQSGPMESAFAEGENSLIVFVTGIGQSYSYLFDDKYLEEGAFENGTLQDYENYAPLIANGEYERIWNLIDFNIDAVVTNLVVIVAKLALSAVLGTYLITDEDVSNMFTKAVHNNIIDEFGNAPADVVTPKYPMPVSEYPGITRDDGTYYSEARRRFFSSIPCEDIAKAKLGEKYEDYLYCFNYPAFSYTQKNATELHEFIETILANNKVGAEKVVLVPMSMGGAMVSAYLAKYPSVEDNHVRRVVSIVGCWNGSDIVSDLLKIDYAENSQELFYGGLFADTLNTMVQKPYGDLAMLALRIFPQYMLSNLIHQFMQSLVNDVFLNTPSLLVLIPDYMHNEFKTMITKQSVYDDVEAYYLAQSTLKDRLEKLEAQGMTFSFICGYGAEYGAFEYPFFKFFKSAQTTNSDEIINVNSTAPGTSSVAYTDKFEDTAGRRLSPDGSVDASTAYYPDCCWYFKGQKHQLDYNNTALSLAIELALGNIKTVQDCDNFEEDGYIFPQFNDSRDLKPLIKSYLPDLNRYLKETGYVLNAQEQELYDKTVAMMNCTVNNREADDALMAQFRDMLVDIGVYEPETTEDQAKDILNDVLSITNQVLFAFFGTKSYTHK